jgi:hypothetical protein
MKFGAAIVGEIRGDLIKFNTKLARATTGGVAEATAGLKGALRGQIRAAGMSQRLANTWQDYLYPESGSSLNAAGVVLSKAPHIIYAYDHGVTIHARNGRFLAVPLPWAVKLIGSGRNRQRITPRLFEQRTGIELVMVQRRGKNPLLVARGVRVTKRGAVRKLTVRGATKTMGERISLTGQAEAAMFVLIPQARVSKRLDVERAAGEWGARAPALIDRRMGAQRE